MGIYSELAEKQKSISVTGLGYVGLPLALELAKHFRVIGYDSDPARVSRMREAEDPSHALDAGDFEGGDIEFTSDPARLKEAQFHIVAVPTDVDMHKVPDLAPLRKASKDIGQALKKGDFVVYESTVYPGCTEEECLPILESESGMKVGADFFLGYSPERIVPGDNLKTLSSITKVVGANDPGTAEQIAEVYLQIIRAGVHITSSIKIAEAAKVIENTQRDLNISLFNELAIMFSELGIDTREVIDAASTKWNFHRYSPGLVGGHCISVDPFYLLYKARQIGLEPQVIAAGRSVNEFMPVFIASKLVKILIESGKNPGDCRVLVMGITFKENIADVRNSKVVSLVRELEEFQLHVDVHDPHADAEEVLKSHKISLINKISSGPYDAIILAVPHKAYLAMQPEEIRSLANGRAVICDIKGVMERSAFGDMQYWRL